MEVDDHFELEHLYLTDRKCRTCEEVKDLISGFYRIRKNKYNSSSYSYECKQCTIKRVTKNRKENTIQCPKLRMFTQIGSVHALFYHLKIVQFINIFR